VRKRVAVLQSCYIPWKGYFDLIHDVDLFVFYDDVQYTKHDWRNRNRIKTAAGVRWLTIPVGQRQDRLLCDVELPASNWCEEHWGRLRGSYSAAPHFERYRSLCESIYTRRWQTLSELNQTTIGWIARQALGIGTELIDSRRFRLSGRKLDRLLDLLRQVEATEYVTGPAARDYIEPERFAAAGITLRWKDYSKYPEYAQLFPPFAHDVTILDLLFHLGPAAPAAIWGG
jgi:hypothetical protein